MLDYVTSYVAEFTYMSGGRLKNVLDSMLDRMQVILILLEAQATAASVTRKRNIR
jgi:hypothetical protein